MKMNWYNCNNICRQQKILKFPATDAELRAYDKFWDSVSVERTLLDDRYQKGMEEGMEKGRAEGMEEGMSQRSLEIARKMLAKGMDEASIMDMTGLTAEDIKLLKAEM